MGSLGAETSSTQEKLLQPEARAKYGKTEGVARLLCKQQKSYAFREHLGSFKVRHTELMKRRVTTFTPHRGQRFGSGLQSIPRIY